MNILRKSRKSKNKKKLNKFVILIFSLVMTTFAWFAYTKILEPTLKMHILSWNIEYSIAGEKKSNPIGIEVSTLYPAMPEQTVTIDIKNKGETLVDIDYEVEAVTIAGITFELVKEGKTRTTDNYIVLAPSVLTTDETTGEKIYKNAITNDISKFPFTVEIEHSSQVPAVTQDESGKKIPGIGYLKVTVNWMGDNDKLDSEWGYLVGEYLANNPTATSVISIVLSVETYQTDPSIEEKTQAPLPSTAYTKPYMPTGFTRIPGTTLDSGLGIQDGDGNQYIWVEVPKNNTVYSESTLALNLDSLSGTALDEAYKAIEDELHTYTSFYRNKTSCKDEFPSDVLVKEATGINTLAEYKKLKQKMLKSVFVNGGFYVGRYETGIEDAPRNSAITQAPVIKQHAYPYNMVTCSQAQGLANSMQSGEYTSSLMFGVQWDLILKYLEAKAVEKGTDLAVIQSELDKDSTNWGNYKDNLWNITNQNSKYSLGNGGKWNERAYGYKTDNSKSIILSTGASSIFCKQGIYDFAGNVWEYLLAYYKSTHVVSDSGGGFSNSGREFWASFHGGAKTNISSSFVRIPCFTLLSCREEYC